MDAKIVPPGDPSSKGSFLMKNTSATTMADMLFRMSQKDDAEMSRMNQQVKDRMPAGSNPEELNTWLAMLWMEHDFSKRWVDSGSIIYEISHSLAAMFCMTSAPKIAVERFPHRAFAVKVPREFCPVVALAGSTDAWILVCEEGALVSAGHHYTSETLLHHEMPDFENPKIWIPRVSNETDTDIEEIDRLSRLNVISYRLLYNTIAYINEYRECVSAKTKSAVVSPKVFAVSQPRDISVSRQFRQAAREVVNSKCLVGVRRAMAHVVRGHWRDQPVGPKRSERRRTWIFPYKRGDESLGRVVQRIERIAEDASPSS